MPRFDTFSCVHTVFLHVDVCFWLAEIFIQSGAPGSTAPKLTLTWPSMVQRSITAHSTTCGTRWNSVSSGYPLHFIRSSCLEISLHNTPPPHSTMETLSPDWKIYFCCTTLMRVWCSQIWNKLCEHDLAIIVGWLSTGYSSWSLNILTSSTGFSIQNLGKRVQLDIMCTWSINLKCSLMSSALPIFYCILASVMHFCVIQILVHIYLIYFLMSI